jgi:hypothetical protein
VTNRTAANGGNFVLHFTELDQPCPGSPPYNSDCSSAHQLSTFPIWKDLNLMDGFASASPVDCNFGSNVTVWYRMTPSENGTLFAAMIPDEAVIPPTNLSYNAGLSVYSAASDCSNLSPVACVDTLDGYTTKFTTPEAHLIGGTTYYIMYCMFLSPQQTVPVQFLSVGFDYIVDPCPADLDNGSGTGTPDGGVDINDLLYFLVRFEGGC